MNHLSGVACIEAIASLGSLRLQDFRSRVDSLGSSSAILVKVIVQVVVPLHLKGPTMITSFGRFSETKIHSGNIRADQYLRAELVSRHRLLLIVRGDISDSSRRVRMTNVIRGEYWSRAHLESCSLLLCFFLW